MTKNKQSIENKIQRRQEELIQLLTEIIIRQNRVIASIQQQLRNAKKYSEELERQKIEDLLLRKGLTSNRDVA
ncbi:MAG: hypothetical protein AB7U37_05570 [Synergistaceae bacterium]|jgi:hypothetical protein